MNCKCNKCKRDDLDITDMVQDMSRPTKYRPLCKECKKVETLEFRKREKEKPVVKKDKLNPTQMKSAGLGGWSGPRKRDEHEATGWLISKMEGVYIPETQHQRNDGLKHIKSRGART